MKNRYIIQFILQCITACFLVFSSCKTETSKQINNPEIGIIDVNSKDIITNRNLSDLIEVDTIISLEYSKNSIIGDIKFAKITDDRIYVIDGSTANALFCFNRQGKFINVFKNVGKGPLEYLSIGDFSVYKNNIYVSASPHRLFKLDKDLRTVEEVKINWELLGKFNNADYILALNDDTLLMAGYSTEYKFNFYDLKRNKFISCFSKSVSHNDAIMCHPPFIRLNNGKIIGMRGYVDTVFQLTPEKITPLKVINYEFAIPENEKLELRKTNFMNRRHSPIYMRDTDDYWENENYISFNYICDRRRHYVFKDKNSDKTIIFRNDLTNDVFGCKFFPCNVHGYYKNDIIISISSDELPDNIDNIKVKIPEDFNKESNPLLILYHPKFN